MNIIFTLIEGGGLVLFIALGMKEPSFTEAFTHSPDAGVFAGAALVFFSYLGFENVANLERLPARGALLMALPMKIGGGSGGPVRIVAVVRRQ